jgi:hypothetical protein
MTLTMQVVFFVLSLLTVSKQSQADCMRVTQSILPSSISDTTVHEQWVLENCSKTSWENIVAVRSKGEFGPESILIPTILPGEQAQIDVMISLPPKDLPAPEYQLIDHHGQPFGKPITTMMPAHAPITYSQLEKILIIVISLVIGLLCLEVLTTRPTPQRIH